MPDNRKNNGPRVGVHRVSCKMILTLLCFFVVASRLERADGVAVMSVDIGSEWLKVAIVSPGVPMEIALNKESKRKTPMTIAFRDNERTFGEDAQITGLRFPKNSFSYILDLLGKSIDNPIVELYRKRFPHYDIISDDERQSIAFRVDGSNVTHTPEELVAQMLHKGKEFAENSAGQKINEAVITVPGFFNQAERRSVLQAAELADLKVLQLINDYTAVALNYGIFRRKQINDSTQYLMFYDMGASSTTATVVGYQNVKSKEKGFAEIIPQVSIMGVGYDRTLGGLEMQVRLQNYLAEEFDKMKKTPNSVFQNARAMAKLFKEAGRVKNVLSANNDHFAQVEGLLDEQDFRLQVTREKLEELCADVFERVGAPIQMALDTAALTMDLISQVVLVGAGTRMPKIQDKLTEILKTELSKNINTDEAAVLGAVYKAADLSQGFKVKKFITKDAVLYPVQIVFDRTIDEKTKQVRKTLFGKMNLYPQKKIITFNKHKEDFGFGVNYAELDHLPKKELAALGHLNLSYVELTGVAEAHKKHAQMKAESKGIRAHFAMDDSGLLNLINVELISEKSSQPRLDEEEGTFSKLGSTISKLFSGSDDSETAEKVEVQPKEDVKPVHEEPQENASSNSNADEKAKEQNQTKASEDKPANQTEKADKKPTITVIKDKIKAVETRHGPQILLGEKLEESREKIKALNLYDMERTRRETALNNLESFVIDAQQKIMSDEYVAAASPEELKKIAKLCNEIQEWLYEDGFDATADVYDEKLASVKKLTNNLYERVFEHHERPDALKGMQSMINGSTVFLMNMRNLTDSEEIFTKVEMETLERVINETRAYHEEIVAYVSVTPMNGPVKYKVRDIANKMAVLDREVKYLVNKAKIWKPKEKSAAAANESKSTQDDVKPDSGSESGDSEEAEPSEPEDSTIDAEKTDAKTMNASDSAKSESKRTQQAEPSEPEDSTIDAEKTDAKTMNASATGDKSSSEPEIVSPAESEKLDEDSHEEL